jgi:hypothetical protein
MKKTGIIKEGLEAIAVYFLKALMAAIYGLIKPDSAAYSFFL